MPPMPHFAAPAEGGRSERSEGGKSAAWGVGGGPGGGRLSEMDEDELANLLMSWYWAGYHTGKYANRRGK
eukprot:518556-Prorocentrum_minimum.AAC.1